MDQHNIARRSPHPHDNFFKTAISDPRVAKEFFKTHLPKSIVDKLDFNSIKFQDRGFIDSELGNSAVDALFLAKFDSEDIYLYLLVEHQSTVDSYMSIRLKKYMLDVCHKHLQSYPKDKKLPLIYPIVFYTGKAPYNASLDLWTLFTDPELAKLFFTNPYQLVNINNIKDEDIENSIWLGNIISILKHASDKNLAHYIALRASSLEIIHKNNYILFKSIVLYCINQNEVNAEDLMRNIKKIKAGNIGEKIMTVAEQLEGRGEARGLKLGKERGLKLGEKKALVKVAKNMLKNGSTPEFVMQNTGLSREEVLGMTLSFA